ncbi:DUF6497 family protein [Paracoccus sp. p4-l81]|uniref:DUF6497 family protein n=1 Tax=unclassified Paracoccus (in: a-proteobacteria) TaxID=2688777 RepID=UPI0035BB81A0
MALSPRQIGLGAALLVAALAAAGWQLRPTPLAPDLDQEGAEAGLTDAELAAHEATTPVIETDEGDLPPGADPVGTPGDQPVGEVIDNPALIEALRQPQADLAQPVGDPIDLPSGRQVWWADSAQDNLGTAGLTHRFRFVAPWLGAGPDEAEQAALRADMTALCETFAVPRLGRPGPLPAQVVITLMQRPITFGDSDRDLVQSFEGFSLTAPEGADPSDPQTPLTCQWEVF